MDSRQDHGVDVVKPTMLQGSIYILPDNLFRWLLAQFPVRFSTFILINTTVILLNTLAIFSVKFWKRWRGSKEDDQKKERKTRSSKSKTKAQLTDSNTTMVRQANKRKKEPTEPAEEESPNRRPKRPNTRRRHPSGERAHGHHPKHQQNHHKHHHHHHHHHNHHQLGRHERDEFGGYESPHGGGATLDEITWISTTEEEVGAGAHPTTQSTGSYKNSKSRIFLEDRLQNNFRSMPPHHKSHYQKQLQNSVHSVASTTAHNKIPDYSLVEQTRKDEPFIFNTSPTKYDTSSVQLSSPSRAKQKKKKKSKRLMKSNRSPHRSKASLMFKDETQNKNSSPATKTPKSKHDSVEVGLSSQTSVWSNSPVDVWDSIPAHRSGSSDNQIRSNKSELSTNLNRDSWIWFSPLSQASVENFAARQSKFRSTDPRVPQLIEEIQRQDQMNKDIQREAISLVEETPSKLSWSDNQCDQLRCVKAPATSPKLLQTGNENPQCGRRNRSPQKSSRKHSSRRNSHRSHNSKVVHEDLFPEKPIQDQITKPEVKQSHEIDKLSCQYLLPTSPHGDCVAHIALINTPPGIVNEPTKPPTELPNTKKNSTFARPESPHKHCLKSGRRHVSRTSSEIDLRDNSKGDSLYSDSFSSHKIKPSVSCILQPYTRKRSPEKSRNISPNRSMQYSQNEPQNLLGWHEVTQLKENFPGEMKNPIILEQEIFKTNDELKRLKTPKTIPNKQEDKKPITACTAIVSDICLKGPSGIQVREESESDSLFLLSSSLDNSTAKGSTQIGQEVSRTIKNLIFKNDSNSSVSINNKMQAETAKKAALSEPSASAPASSTNSANNNYDQSGATIPKPVYTFINAKRVPSEVALNSEDSLKKSDMTCSSPARRQQRRNVFSPEYYLGKRAQSLSKKKHESDLIQASDSSNRL